MNFAKFYRNRLRGFDSLGVEFDFSHWNAISPLIQGVRSFACDNKIVIVIIMCSKAMFLHALNTLITITFQTYGTLGGVHVLSAVFLKD